MAAINKVKKHQKFTEDYLDNHAPNFNSNYSAVANPLDTSAN